MNRRKLPRRVQRRLPMYPPGLHAERDRPVLDWDRAKILWRPEGLELRIPLHLGEGALASFAADEVWGEEPLASIRHEIWSGWLALASPRLLEDIDPTMLRRMLDAAAKRARDVRGREQGRVEDFLRRLRDDPSTRPLPGGPGRDVLPPSPDRSVDQRMSARERVNEVRARRAELKRDLKAGRKSIDALLLDPPEYIETAKVFDILLMIPGYARVKVSKVLTHCRIAPSKTIGGLSERQRRELIALLNL